MSDLYNYIETLCSYKGISITEMCRASGASRGSLTDLKKGRITSLSPETLRKIADYFGVSMDELYGRKTDEEIEVTDMPPITMIARAGKKMTPEQQKILLRFAKFTFPEAFEDES